MTKGASTISVLARALSDYYASATSTKTAPISKARFARTLGISVKTLQQYLDGAT